MQEFNIKVGDLLIPNDEFISLTGCKEVEVTEIAMFKHELLFQKEECYDITIGGIVNIFGSIHGDYKDYRCFKTINFKVNPEIHVEIGWNLYGKYCKGIFFTSDDEKKIWKEKIREKKMNEHLFLARTYGYKG